MNRRTIWLLIAASVVLTLVGGCDSVGEDPVAVALEITEVSPAQVLLFEDPVSLDITGTGFTNIGQVVLYKDGYPKDATSIQNNSDQTVIAEFDYFYDFDGSYNQVGVYDLEVIDGDENSDRMIAALEVAEFEVLLRQEGAEAVTLNWGPGESLVVYGMDFEGKQFDLARDDPDADAWFDLHAEVDPQLGSTASTGMQGMLLLASGKSTLDDAEHLHHVSYNDTTMTDVAVGDIYGIKGQDPNRVIVLLVTDVGNTAGAQYVTFEYMVVKIFL